MMVLAGLQYDGKTSSADFAKDIFVKLTTWVPRKYTSELLDIIIIVIVIFKLQFEHIRATIELLE